MCIDTEIFAHGRNSCEFLPLLMIRLNHVTCPDHIRMPIGGVVWSGREESVPFPYLSLTDILIRAYSMLFSVSLRITSNNDDDDHDKFPLK